MTHWYTAVAIVHTGRRYNAETDSTTDEIDIATGFYFADEANKACLQHVAAIRRRDPDCQITGLAAHKHPKDAPEWTKHLSTNFSRSSTGGLSSWNSRTRN